MAIFSSSGSTKNTMAFLKKAETDSFFQGLEAVAQVGVNALASMTPIESGLTASSWGYEIIDTPGGVKIQWVNNNIQDGVPVAILIQYGHGTGTGGYVSGQDFINPAMQPIFLSIIEDTWRKVTTA